MKDDTESRAKHALLDDAGRTPGVSTEVLDPSRLVTPAQLAVLRKEFPRAIALAGGRGEIRVRLVADTEMAAAHLRYSGIEGTTDVLTFDMRDDMRSEDGMEPASGELDADLWVCVDEARRHADQRGFAVERELLLYCLHGVLHCLGFDDHDDEEFARMHAEEDRILTAIGVGATYAAGHAAGHGGGDRS